MTSDIPGNPHAFDDSVISLFRTLPELNNFNIVWTSLPLSEPLVFKGSLPPARINSLSIYAPDAVPTSIDLAKATRGADGELKIKIENSTAESTGNFLATNDWSRGFLVMRNYLVPPGTRVVTPRLERAADGSVVRAAQVLIAGPPSTAKALLSKTVVKLKKLLIANSLFLLIFKHLLGAKARLCISLITAAGVAAVLMYRLLYIAGGKSLKKLSSLFCCKTNQLFPISLEKGAAVSQPSTMHRYWMMQLDVPVNAAMHVRGKIKPENQKYWSLIVYDEFGVPLPQFVYDENANKTPLPNEGGAYNFDICISSDPEQALRGCAEGSTVIDISQRSEMRKGYVLFRIVHPEGPAEEVERYSAPEASLQFIHQGGDKKTD